MSISKLFLPALIALGIAFGTPIGASAAEPHGHGAAAVQLKLDGGKKWQTDEPLRRGMSEIRLAMAEAVPAVHSGKFSPDQYRALAARIQTQIDYVVGNCRLPEAADEQLHIVLEQIIDAVPELTAAGHGDQAAGKIVGALNAYGEYFDHAGWVRFTL